MTGAIRFDNGAAYERYMGRWSQSVGEAFIDWLAPRPGLRWLDIGCGNGAFTEMIFRRCAPAMVDGIDPSEGQLAYARAQPVLRSARFQQGDAMALPHADDAFDVAVMPLVIFFVPEPARGVAEMTRVVRPGGITAAYAWDMEGGGFPYEVLHEEIRALGVAVPTPPSMAASGLPVMRDLWQAAGLEQVDTRTIRVQRVYPDFDDYWQTVLGGPSAGAQIKALSDAQRAQLQERLRTRLAPDAAGRITWTARANAVMGQVPA